MVIFKMSRYSNTAAGSLLPEESFADFKEETTGLVSDGSDVLKGIVALEAIHEKLLGISMESLEQHHIKLSLENRLLEVKELLADSNIKVNVSMEGFFGTVVKVVKWFFEQFKKIWNWIMDKIKWLFNYNHVRNKVNAAAAEDIRKEAKKEAKQSTKIVIPCPYTCYTYFHTSSFKPQAGYEFNENNVLKSMEGIKAGINRVGNAVEESINDFTSIAETIFNAIEIGRNVNSAETHKYVRRGQLGQLIDGKFDMMGFRLYSEPPKETNPYIKEFPRMAPVLEEMGWKDKEKTFNITVNNSAVTDLADKLEAQGKLVAAESKAILDLLKSKQILKRLKDYKPPPGAGAYDIPDPKAGPALTEEKRRTIYWNARAVSNCYDAVRTVQILAEKYGFFLQQYHANNTAILVGLRSQYKQAT